MRLVWGGTRERSLVGGDQHIVGRIMEYKPWYESKVLWFNVIMTIVMAVPVISAAIEALSPEKAVLIGSVAGLITGLGNVFLRVWFTDTPINNAKMRATWDDVEINCE